MIDIANIPHKPWVYQFKDKKGNILYIWKAKNLKNRVSQYFNPNSVWKQEMLNLAEIVDFFQVKTESEALYLEDNLIKKYQPPFNNMLKWSNSYAYIKITNDDFPQIIITRNKIKDWSKYIWPKYNTRELKNFLQYLRYLLKWRGCKKTEFKKWKVCSDCHFWLCQWRCSKQYFPDREQAKKEYSDIIYLIEQFFRWNTKPVEQEIKKQIQIAAENQHFERAAKLRDIYLQIENLVEKQTVVLPKDTTWYVCQIREISGWLVYTVLNFYEWKLIDVIINKKNKEDFDENSVLSSLESELGNLEKKEIDGSVFYYTKKIKLNKTQTNDINALIDWFFDSYVVGESFRDENMINWLLATLQQKYSLKNFPYQIECVDISHLSWAYTSGGLSCFVWWIPNYKLYRKYKINAKIDVKSGDDYAALTEVITRRFHSNVSPFLKVVAEGQGILSNEEISKNPQSDKSDSSFTKEHNNFPDLFILDGWKGQLGILRDLLKQERFQKVYSKVDFVSLGKWVARHTGGKLKWEKEKIFKFNDSFEIQQIDLDYDQADKIFVKIRDEAHRFCNAYRKEQMKIWLKSELKKGK